MLIHFSIRSVSQGLMKKITVLTINTMTRAAPTSREPAATSAAMTMPATIAVRSERVTKDAK